MSSRQNLYLYRINIIEDSKEYYHPKCDALVNKQVRILHAHQCWHYIVSLHGLEFNRLQTTAEQMLQPEEHCFWFLKTQALKMAYRSQNGLLAVGCITTEEPEVRVQHLLQQAACKQFYLSQRGTSHLVASSHTVVAS